MKMRFRAVLLAVLFTVSAGVVCAGAPFEPEAEKAYNTAVQGQDALNGLDVTVKESTVSSLTNISDEKEVRLKVSGIKSTLLSADLQTQSGDVVSQSWYQNGYYYETTSEGKKIRREMDRSAIWDKINSSIYLDMTSNYLTMLYSFSGQDGETVFYFASDQKTLGDYANKLLDSYANEKGAAIHSMQGEMEVDADGHVVRRDITLIYGIPAAGTEEVFCKKANAVFNTDEDVKVQLPNLSEYTDAENEKPAVKITPLSRTLYVTADVNVRAAGSLDAAVIGGYNAGSGVTQTAYTSDGWVQIQYDGGTGYIWGAYTSTEQPVFTQDQSGTMYALTDVNVRTGWTVQSEKIGTLSKGRSVQITGTTSNGWTRVVFEGQKGYIASNYLTWSEPVREENENQASINGFVLDASLGVLTVESAYTGETVVFNTSYAQMYLQDTLETGDLVTIRFYGASSPYTALTVTDNIKHGGKPGDNVYLTTSGTVTDFDGDIMGMSCSDGTYRSFDVTNAFIGRNVEIAEGVFLTVTWNGSQSGNRALKAQTVE